MNNFGRVKSRAEEQFLLIFLLYLYTLIYIYCLTFSVNDIFQEFDVKFYCMSINIYILKK
jgi:hypothetical protein